MANTAKISKLIKSQFPQFYHEEGERFMAFVEAYYEYMEQTGKMSDELRNLSSYQDISTTTEDFIKYYINSFLPSVPLDAMADKKLMVKNIRQFNIARGTLASYKLLFRALYNQDVDVTYPSNQILKVSDGDWRKERYLVVSYDPQVYTFIGKTIVGRTTGSQALVEDVIRKTIRGRDVSQIILSNVKGIFDHKEPITLLSEIDNPTPFFVIAEAGIASAEVISTGGSYLVGDVVDLISEDIGEYGKAVVTETQDLLGSLTYSLVDGGSGYTESGSRTTTIDFIGGDGTEPGSFQITRNDITDTFAIAICTSYINANTIYGALAPTVTGADGNPVTMNTFANVIIGASSYGFPELAEAVTEGIDYRDHQNALLTVANTQTLSIGSSLFGATSGANATITDVIAGSPGSAVLKIDGYKNFTSSETVRISTSGGASVGSVTTFSGNVVGYHVLDVANLASVTVSVGDELVGINSGSYGVVQKIANQITGGYTNSENPSDVRDLLTLIVSANTSSNLTSQFDVGPVKGFIEHEPLRFVGSATVIANGETTTSNVYHETLYTKLQDALLFAATTFGTISKLSLPISGSGYSVAPTISVRNNTIAALGVGEAYLTLQTDDINWSTGNSSYTSIDTNDRIYQSSTGASGDVKVISAPKVAYANGTYEMVVRVWQPPLQRAPGNINFSNNSTVQIQIFDSEYVFGETDSRSVVGTGSAKIVSIDDRGILGQNANIKANVGANGAIVALRVIDSGFSYKDNEIVIIEAPNRPLSVSASTRISLRGVANSEGYYSTTKGHVSSRRGIIQDNRYYQEFSYEVVSPLSLDKYRDTVLKLVHPAGQALFGKFQTQSNAYMDIATSSTRLVRTKAAGTVSINSGSRLVLGSGTSFLSEYANSGSMIIEYADGQYYKLPINIVSTNTSANLSIAWSNTSISGANAYYQTAR